MVDELNVFLDTYEDYELVGTLSFVDRVPTILTYDETFIEDVNGTAVSVTLPITTRRHEGRPVSAWFEALMPEGRVGRIIREAEERANDDMPVLAKLSDETIGALVLSTSQAIESDNETYEPIEPSFFEDFARSPARTAARVLTGARLSLSGEMAKVGLYLDEESGRWYLPLGNAPSTHIIKAQNNEYEEQSVNEAFCMRVATLCGLDGAETQLVAVEGYAPLLLSRRFDRETLLDDPRRVNGMIRPMRLHQEDFCQALGLPGEMKYEPTGGNYAHHIARTLTSVAASGLQERRIFFSQLLFSFLIGNCDNHLKNYSVVYGESNRSGFISPIYDVTCTTVYPDLAREMGVALCPSRKIDDVTLSDIISTGRSCSIGSEQAILDQVVELCKALPDAMVGAELELVGGGFTHEGGICSEIRKDVLRRIDQIGHPGHEMPVALDNEHGEPER